MTRIYLIIVLFFSSLLSVFAQSIPAGKSMTDTVYYNYSNTANTATISVSLGATQAVSSFDFSIKLNTQVLKYDTVIIQATYLDFGYAYFNETDSTIRFTSFSLQNYQNHSILLTIQLTKMNTVTAADLSPVISFLNGELSKSTLILPSTGISENQDPLTFMCFPNPAKDFINIISDQTVNISLYDHNGVQCTEPVLVGQGIIRQIDLPALPAGVYFLSAWHKNSRTIRKVIVRD